MMTAPKPTDELKRLMALDRYDILDTGREEVFDRITRLAARVLNVPMAAINFLDVDRHWSKSMVGFDAPESPRQLSFCALTVLNDGPTVLPDLAADPRFEQHPAVLQEPHLRMYAGAPLSTPGGQRIGTVCVMDTAPRQLSPDDLRVLQDLAGIAMSELELRLQLRQTGRQLEAQQHWNAELQRSLDHAEVLEAVSSLMDLSVEPEEVALQAAALVGQAIGADWAGIVVYNSASGAAFTQRAYAHPDLHPVILELATQLNSSKGGVTHTVRQLTEPYYLDSYPDHPNALPQAVEAGLQATSWIPLGQWGDRAFQLLVMRSGEPRKHPWRESDRSLLEAASRSVRVALHRREAMDTAGQLAHTDVLTGVRNRRAFDEDLGRRMEQDADFLLTVIDLDGFKAVNDLEGHAQGDKVLRVFASVLAAGTPSDSVYRFGGDEFALMLPHAFSEAEVDDLVDVAVVSARQMSVAQVGASVGLALNSEATSVVGVLALADHRMYEAKRRRRERQATVS
ncbi:diguanylate cyclase [Deinococcus altitudinis]|uniref:sensor domain-containing diguanylate cyclase n=1 Tax=Deinococcus altitudinis TaxID=468914 RepID=UPI0038925A7D